MEEITRLCIYVLYCQNSFQQGHTDTSCSCTNGLKGDYFCDSAKALMSVMDNLYG